MLNHLLPTALLVAVAEAGMMHGGRPQGQWSGAAHNYHTPPFSGSDAWSHNGLSPLGTNQAQHFPKFLDSNPLPNGFPWGKKNPYTNYYTDYPYTGVVRYYDWTVAKQDCAPDGVNTTCLLINGQFPGPTIEVNWGDRIQVKLTNAIEDEGAAIHWHGILQKGSQPMDGVPGVSQCPIAPGQSFTYSFDASLYGTTWWHGHYSSQYASGMAGPIVIHGPETADYDIDLGPVCFLSIALFLVLRLHADCCQIMVNDWYHTYYKDLLDVLEVPVSTGPVYPHSKNILVNGKNPFICANADGAPCDQAPLAAFNLTSSKKHRMRFINSGADATLKISLDDHQFQVIANDFVPIQPYYTDTITLGIGQRSDVIVQAKDANDGAYWLRVFAPPGCASVAKDGQDIGKAAIYYQNANRDALPISPPNPGFMEIIDCRNDPLNLTAPIMELASGDPSVSVDVVMDGHPNATGYPHWWMNDVTAVVDLNDPILLQSKLGNNSFPEERNVYQYDSSKKSVRFVVKNRSGNSHPMHFHGHNMFILAEGTGNATWDGTVVRPDNPQRRDVQIVSSWGFIVLQWNQDNPGAWPFHCHIAWHLSMGMIIEVLESPDLIPTDVNVPSTVGDTCRQWWAWSGHNIVDQIDSGI
jgi:FtsP/CotA-like multicopper oxidase with cupredoxin domain